MNRPTEKVKHHRQAKGTRPQREPKYELLLPDDLDRAIDPHFLTPTPFSVTPDEIENSGYAVISQRYLARLEFIAATTFAFLDHRMDQETFMEELTNG